jgi:predicted Zn-dependent protease
LLISITFRATERIVPRQPRLAARVEGMQSLMPDVGGGSWRCNALGCIALVALVAAGCATGRTSRLPAPRERDAAALRAQAAARPNDAEPLYQLALLQAREAGPDSALLALAGALRREARHAASLALLAQLLHETGQDAEAVRFFEKRGISTLPEAAQINVALLYAETGNTVKARKMLQAVQGDTYASAVAVNLAYLDLLDESGPATLATLEALAGRYPDAPEVQMNVALARLRTGDVDAGMRLLQEIGARHPDYAPVQANLALALQHYTFDTDGAEKATARARALAARRSSLLAFERAMHGGAEDTSPPVPQPASTIQGAHP